MLRRNFLAGSICAAYTSPTIFSKNVIKVAKPLRRCEISSDLSNISDYVMRSPGSSLISEIRPIVEEVGRSFFVKPSPRFLKDPCQDIVMATHNEKENLDIIYYGLDFFRYAKENFYFSEYIIRGVTAHECWHLDQFRRNERNTSNVFELKADVMAGYYLGVLRADVVFDVNAVIEWICESMSENGSPKTHGTPFQRQRCLSAGYSFGYSNGPQPLATLRKIANNYAVTA